MAETKRKNILNLSKTEYVIAAHGENCCGSGWANSPVFVFIGDGATGKIRQSCIQPENQTKEMVDIFAFSALAHSRMTNFVKKLTNKTN